MLNTLENWDFPNEINKDKLKAGDKNEFLKLGYSINPEKFVKLVKLTVPNFELKSETDFTELLENDKFRFGSFLGMYKSNSEELVNAAKSNRLRAK